MSGEEKNHSLGIGKPPAWIIKYIQIGHQQRAAFQVKNENIYAKGIEDP